MEAKKFDDEFTRLREELLTAKEQAAKEVIEIIAKLVPIGRLSNGEKEKFKNLVLTRWREMQIWITK